MQPLSKRKNIANSWHFCNHFAIFLHLNISKIRYIFSNVQVFFSAHEYGGEIVLRKVEVHTSKSMEKSLVKNSTILQVKKCTKITLSVGVRQSSDNLARQHFPASDNSILTSLSYAKLPPTPLSCWSLSVVLIRADYLVLESRVSHAEACDVTCCEISAILFGLLISRDLGTWRSKTYHHPSELLRYGFILVLACLL